MTTVVFANVGTRDVAIDGQIVRGDVRSRGKEILDNLPSLQGRLSFPIIEPTLEYLMAHFGPVKRLVLIATDQEDQNYQKRDTLYFARVIAHVLEERYRGQLTCEVSRLTNVNPSSYDDVFPLFRDLLLPYEDDNIQYYFLMIAGGIPACNTSLLLQGLRLFGSRTRVVYQAEVGQPKLLQVGQHVMVTDLVNHFDFAAAHNLLQGQDRVNAVALALLQYASSRLWFDFKAAHSHLEEAIEQSHGTLYQKLRSIGEELNDLRAGDELALIGELYHNAVITWDNGRYVDFLGRATRFQEAVLHYLVTRLAKEGQLQSAVSARDLSTQPGLRGFLLENLERLSGNQARPELVVDEEKEQRLRRILNEYFNLTELKDLCFDLRIDYENLPGATKQDKARELVAYARRHGLSNDLIVTSRQRRPNAPWWNEVGLPARTATALLPVAIPVLKRLESLVSLRYDSIIAHGFRGVSVDIILQTYNQSSPDAGLNPVRDMTVVSSELGISSGNPFRVVRDLIIGQLR